MVELTSMVRPETPTAAKNILNRINEIASMQGLATELRALQARNRDVPKARIRMHVLSLPDVMAASDLEPSLKRTVDGMLFESLRRTGRAACDDWLAAHFDAIGQRSTVDIDARYLDRFAPPRTPPPDARPFHSSPEYPVRTDRPLGHPAMFDIERTPLASRSRVALELPRPLDHCRRAAPSKWNGRPQIKRGELR